MEFLEKPKEEVEPKKELVKIYNYKNDLFQIPEAETAFENRVNITEEECVRNMVCESLISYNLFESYSICLYHIMYLSHITFERHCYENDECFSISYFHKNDEKYEITCTIRSKMSKCTAKFTETGNILHKRCHLARLKPSVFTQVATFLLNRPEEFVAITPRQNKSHDFNGNPLLFAYTGMI